VVVFLFVAGCLVVSGLLRWQPMVRPRLVAVTWESEGDWELSHSIRLVDEEFERRWAEQGLEPAPEADLLTLARRLGLALVGSIPSLEEVRRLEALPEEGRLEAWLEYLLVDPRCGDYLAERFARMLVGVEDGPFILYRRHRLVSWLRAQIQANRPYDELVRELITAEGLWTSHPEVNFLTATVDPNGAAGGPDEVKLAGRVSKAFLGVRLDCVECHDDFLGGPWKQADFHQLAAFFATSELGLTGLRDDPTNEHVFRYRGQAEPVVVEPRVPFDEDLLRSGGGRRGQLAGWVTHPENRAFARTLVNRVWALMFGRPLVNPVDSIPLEGPFPPGMEQLAADWVRHGYDLRRLIRVIAGTKAFRRDSRWTETETEAEAEAEAETAVAVGQAQEAAFAVFPLSRLRPEQVAGGIWQGAQLRTVDAESHVLVRLMRIIQERDFVRRYGDAGEAEFEPRGGTVPQRLMMMNGDLVQDRIKPDLMWNASTRVGVLAPSDEAAVEAAYLAVLTRRPSEEERRHFVQRLRGTSGSERGAVLEDLFWVLMNSTEFAWNH